MTSTPAAAAALRAENEALRDQQAATSEILRVISQSRADVQPVFDAIVQSAKRLQVRLNLLSNALKFTPEGGHVEVRVGIADGFAEVAVTDTGIGIASEDHDAVFEEFRQVGSSDRKAEGTGLGLLPLKDTA